jgi:hypothetical protein
MDYNGLCTSLLLLRLSNGEYIPLPSVQASYGPFNSFDEAYADLVNTFKEISNVPRGYTLCIIENGKPQEYWLTRTGDWASKEKKNASSSSSSVVSGLVLEAREGYIQVSYDGGDTWTPLVALEDLRGKAGLNGSPGKDGKDATSDLSKIQMMLTSRVVTPDDPNEDPYTVYTLKYTVNGINWITVGDIRSGSGGGGDVDISIETYTDGNQYWKMNGTWMRDDHGNMVRANGRDGADGADGAGYYTQFKSIIFKRSNNTRIVNGVEMLQESEYPEGGTYSHPYPFTGNWHDGVPVGTAKLWMSTKWFSTNEAITDANQWSTPSPATDTADMDFEYSNAPLEEIPNDPGPNKTINMYNASTNPNGWYDADETEDYNGNELLQDANWMAMRVCKNGVWGSWKVFKIRGESGENPVVPTVSFMSTVFRRSNNYSVQVIDNKAVEKLATSEYPQGGEYSSPVPTNSIGGVLLWSDGVPRGEEKLWVSTRVFYSDNTPSSWREPVPVGDTGTMDFEWCDEENPRYAYPTRRSPSDINPDKAVQDDGWYDEPDSNADPIWMAMRPVKDGVYDSTDWQVMRVKGERGTDGTSFRAKGELFCIYDTLADAQECYRDNSSTIEGTFAIVGTNLTELYEFSFANPNGQRIVPLTVGDAYINADGLGKFKKTAGDLKTHVFIWDGDNFVDFGNIQGPEGKPVYFHIKYSNDEGRHFTTTAGVEDGETPGDWIGLRVDTVMADSMNPSDYTWSKFKGEDGFGYEYIFKLTADEHAPLVPTLEECTPYKINEGTQDEMTITYQDDDYVPEGWTDDPGSPTKALPYCWVAYRRYVNGEWQPYRGGSADSRYAALFSVYTSNGRGVDHIEEKYAIWNYGDEEHVPPLSEFGDTIPEFRFPDYKYLWNYEIIYYDDNTTQTTAPECIAVSERGVGIAKVQEFYYACNYGDPNQSNPDFSRYIPTWGSVDNGRSDAWKTKPMAVDKNNQFLWNFELITFTDGKETWTDPVPIAYYIYTDIEYLLTIFKKVEGSSDTAYLGGLLGVVERGSDNNDVIRAMLNATDLGKSTEHGKLFIASGFRGTTDVNNATFKVYEDGRVEMKDAFIQGFLEQYYKTYENVKDPNRAGQYGGDMQIAPNKMSNCISIPWKTLGISNETHLDLSSPLYPLPVGKITITNSWYVMDDGTMYYNTNNNVSRISIQAFLPDGVLAYVNVALCNGWIQISKLNFLDADNNPIITTNTGFNNVYVIHGWGGNVLFNTNYEVRVPTTNNNQVVTGFTASDKYGAVRNVPADETVIRVNTSNTTLIDIVGGAAEEATRYVVLPIFRLLSTDNVGVSTSVDSFKPVSYLFKISSSSSATFVFKINKIAKQFNDADADDLQDLKVLGPNDVYNVGTPLVVTTNGTVKWFKLTYLPFTGISTTPYWILEAVNPIATI